MNTAHDVYLSNKPEVNVKTCTKIECDITNTVFEYCSLTDAISNIHICAESENSEQEIDTTMCPTLTNLNNSLDFYTHQLTPQDNNNPALSEFAEMTGWTKSESEPVSVSVSYN